jgi:hypothetical protein
MFSPYANLLERAIAHRAVQASAPETVRETGFITGYLFSTPSNDGRGWHLVGMVNDPSSPMDQRLRVWWNSHTQEAAIDRADGGGFEPLP